MDKVGRYELIRELGRGGMAVVYLARDPYMNREVAVKILPPHLTVDPQFRARFQREAQVIAALDHPAIVPVYDFGEHEKRLYIVMRFMAGGSLADRLKRDGPFSVEDTARLLERIGSALDEAHQKGIVHRDLKPANILFDHRDQPSVGDFGIVKLSEATVAYTGENIIGTPGYMSPEQARGDDDIDGRSDIYALGAIAYEMLTGKLPYKADTPIGLMMKHIIEPVPNILDVKPDLPQSAAKTISKAMAKERNGRFDTCQDIAKSLQERLEPVLEETMLEPVVAEDPADAATVLETPSPSSAVVPATDLLPSSPIPAQKTRRAVPRWAAIAGCLVLLICGGGGAALAGLRISGVIGGDEPTSTPTTTTTELVDGEPTDTPEPDNGTPVSIEPEYLTIDSDVAGASISYPADWTAEEEEGIITVASDEALLTDDSGFRDGAALAVFSSSAEIFESDNPTEMLSFAIDSFGLGDVTVVGEPVETSLNGQLAATADVTFSGDDGLPMSGVLALVTNEDRVAILFGGTATESSEKYLPILNSILQTIVVREPTAVLTLSEPDLNNPSGVLTYGETVNGTLQVGQPAIWTLIGFESDSLVVAGERVSGDLDIVLDILDETGQSILAGGPVDEGEISERVSDVNLPYSGNYYIVVRGFGDSSGGYELTVTSGADAANLTQPGSLLIATDDIPASDDHVFPFAANGSGQTVSAMVSSDSGMDFALGLYIDGSDEVLEIVDDTFAGEELVYTVGESGNYYFAVYTVGEESGEYQIVLLGSPEIVFELASGDSVFGVFDESSLIEYRLRGFVDQSFDVLVQPDGTLDVVVELYNLENLSEVLVEIDEGFGGEAEFLTYTPDVDAVYVIVVRGFGGEEGSYTLTVD